jgi:hypothetical protein
MVKNDHAIRSFLLGDMAILNYIRLLVGGIAFATKLQTNNDGEV